MTELTDLSETDSSNTSISGYSTDGSIANMSTTDNVFQAILGMLARSVSEDTLAGAGTTNLGSVPGTNVNVTGSGATITALGTIKAGTLKILRFSGANTLTYNATSLKLYSKTNITTYDGLVMTFVSLGSGNWIEVSQTPAYGTFSPEPAFDGNTTGIAGTFTGRWSRHGNTVQVWVTITFTNKGSATGAFALGDLPFIAASGVSKWSGAVSGMNNAFSTLVAGMTCYVMAAQDALYLEAPTSAGAAAVSNANITNTSQFSAHVVYEAA